MHSPGRRFGVTLATVLSLAMLAAPLPALAQSGTPAQPAKPAQSSQAVQEISPEHLALARKYVDLTDKQQVYETTVVQVAIDTTRQILSQNPKLTDKVNAVVTDVVKSYKPRKGELLNQIARVYAQKFSVPELKKIVAFYSSDVGQKLAIQNVYINQQLVKVMQLFQANLSTEFYAKVKAGLKKDGIDL